jgi:hypothetical protein
MAADCCILDKQFIYRPLASANNIEDRKQTTHCTPGLFNKCLKKQRSLPQSIVSQRAMVHIRCIFRHMLIFQLF